MENYSIIGSNPPPAEISAYLKTRSLSHKKGFNAWAGRRDLAKRSFNVWAGKRQVRNRFNKRRPWGGAPSA
jgi:hypothetical protein